MRLIVGVTNDPGANVTSGTTYPGTNPVSVNGGRSNTTNYILDGAQNNDIYSNAPSPLPNPDALQEFSVQTNNFGAEFGRQSGGIVNAVTRSGSNEYRCLNTFATTRSTRPTTSRPSSMAPRSAMV
jgi:TonB-dependent Receptor Plug Domain